MLLVDARYASLKSAIFAPSTGVDNIPVDRILDVSTRH